MSHHDQELQNPDDPVIGWTYFVSVVGILLFLVGVYFAHGIYYQTVGMDKDEKNEQGVSALYTITVEAQQERLQRNDSWSAKVGDKEEIVTKEDGTQKKVMTAVYRDIPTKPVSEVQSQVLAELKAKQGK